MHLLCQSFNISIDLKYYSLILVLLFTWVCTIANAQVISHTVCAGDAQVKRYFVTNPQAGANYNWILNTGGNIINQNADTAYVVWGNTPGIYSIATVSNIGSSCISDTAFYWIEVIDKSVVNITGIDSVCVGVKVSLTTSGANPIIWSNGSSNPTTDFYPTSTTTVWAIGGSGACRSDTAFFTIYAEPFPSINFSATPNSGEEPLTVIFQNNTQFADEFTWDFGDGFGSFDENPSHVYEESGKYVVRLTARNEFGCETTQTYQFIQVNALFAVYVPNAFTPGKQDDLNNSFKPIFTQLVPYQLSIYNRWGEIVFNEKSTDAAWHAVSQNGFIVDGVYTYTIRFIDPIELTDQYISGSVLVIGN